MREAMGPARTYVACVAMLLVSACDAGRWEDVFSREASLDRGHAGWNGGDAALSVELPGGRSLWLFGDSFITRVGDDGQRLRNRDGSTLSLGTFIAVHDDYAEPDPDEIRFWASRRGRTAEITGPAASTRYEGFFTHERLGLPRPAAARTWLWPAGAWSDGPSLVVALTEVRACVPELSNILFECFVLPGASGVDVLDTLIVSIPDASGPPDAWLDRAVTRRVSAAGLGAHVQWGKAFLNGPDDQIYIFGVRQLGTTSRPELVMGRAHPEDVGTPHAWSVRVEEGWEPPSELQGTLTEAESVADDVGAFVSVHRVTRRGVTRYILTHTHPVPAGPPGLPVPPSERRPSSHHVFLRVAEWTANRGPSWTPLDDSVQRFDLLRHDPELRRAAEARFELGLCDDPSLHACGISYHAIAHPELSRQDARGDARAVVSYIMPHDGRTGRPTETFPPLAHAYRPRFRMIHYDSLRPWCELAGSSCEREARASGGRTSSGHP